MAYFKLLTELKSILDSDSRIKTVLDNDVEGQLIDVYKQNIPALAHITISDFTPSEDAAVVTFSVLVQCIDIVTENNNLTTEKFKGNSNIQEVYSNMQNVITKMYNVLKKDVDGTNINILSVSPSSKILDGDTNNRLAGWATDFQVQVPNTDMDVCQVV